MDLNRLQVALASAKEASALKVEEIRLALTGGTDSSAAFCEWASGRSYEMARTLLEQVGPDVTAELAGSAPTYTRKRALSRVLVEIGADDYKAVASAMNRFDKMGFSVVDQAALARAGTFTDVESFFKAVEAQISDRQRLDAAIKKRNDALKIVDAQDKIIREIKAGQAAQDI